jgi:hypothetical protein
MAIEEVLNKAIEKVKGKSGQEGDVHTQSGSDPHAEFEQSHPAVNKDEPQAFANPEEAGAKKPSEEVTGEKNEPQRGV